MPRSLVRDRPEVALEVLDAVLDLLAADLDWLEAELRADPLLAAREPVFDLELAERELLLLRLLRPDLDGIAIPPPLFSCDVGPVSTGCQRVQIAPRSLRSGSFCAGLLYIRSMSMSSVIR